MLVPMQIDYHLSHSRSSYHSVAAWQAGRVSPAERCGAREKRRHPRRLRPAYGQQGTALNPGRQDSSEVYG